MTYIDIDIVSGIPIKKSIDVDSEQNKLIPKQFNPYTFVGSLNVPAGHDLYADDPAGQ